MAVISQDAKIYIAGHRGLVGSALYQILAQKGYQNLINSIDAKSIKKMGL